MKRLAFISLILTLSVFYTGCKTSQPAIYESVMTRSVNEDDKGSGTAEAVYTVQEKLTMINNLEKKFLELQTEYLDKQEDLTKKGEKYGRLRVGLIIGGIALASGSAVAAVLAPAWVIAGLAAVSGGVVTVQGVYVEEGFTSDAVKQAKKKMQDDRKALGEEKFADFIAKARLAVKTNNEKDFFDNLGEAEKIVYRLYKILTTDYIIEGKESTEDRNGANDVGNTTPESTGDTPGTGETGTDDTGSETPGES